MGLRKLLSYAVLFSLLATFSQAYNCWQHDGNQTACQAISSDCFWTTSATDPWCTDPTGCCDMKGCWLFDQNQAACESDTSCNWQPNNLNQNPWCDNNIGCCDKKGCWSFINTNQSGCEGAFGGGICGWDSGDDPWCPEPIGCCHPKGCNDFTNQTICEMAKNMFDMPCNWTGSQCTDQGFNSFGSADSCVNSGGWWNPTSQQCEMPSGTGSMSGGETHCWFADNQPNVCTNITGCVYCTQAKLSDPASACYNEQLGWCQGHETMPGATDIDQDALSCIDVKLKQVCNCGPLPNCKWNNTNTSQGTYCMEGAKTDDQRASCQPPAQFCDDTNSKSNQTVCNQLAENYFMPCEWDNTSSTPQCKFKADSMFKDGMGGFNDIGSESSCFAAGGQWKTVSFTDPSGMIKTDSWCEMGSGNGFEQCDDSCWACEFKPDASAWANAAQAQSACQNSSLGFCKWSTDTNAFNGFGWCDFPTDFSFGGSDCSSDCKGCNFANNPQQACTQSSAGCQWINNNCISLSKKTCDTDCFSCYDSSTCFASGAQCAWSQNPTYCKPIGFTGEICFDGMDNDNNGKTDCQDPACSFDQFCGGNFMSGGMQGDDCKQRGMNQTYCTEGTMPMGNCTWVSMPWGEQFCDFPGANCWTFDSNSTGCSAQTGCEWINLTAEGEQQYCEVIENECFIPNQTLCQATPGCVWTPDLNSPIGGFCDTAIFAQCNNYHDAQSCNNSSNCTWSTDMFGGMSRCEPVCFSLSSASCSNATYSSICTLMETACEPSFSMMGDCPQYDNNQTACMQNNATCFWTPQGAGGLCDGKGMQMMFQGMDPSPPHELGQDAEDTAVAEQDILFFGLKDMADSFGFGIGARSIQDATLCNGVGAFSGHNTTQFFWYLDTDGSTNGGCQAYNTGGLHDDGFEFMVKSTASWENSQAVETNNFYTCSSGNWTLTNMPITSNKMMMCMELGGAMVAVDKESIEAFTALYNKSKPMRVFVASAGPSNNRTSPSDSAAEGWYTVGTADFKFECCDCPGQDIDGDGFKSEMDPDCKMVKKFGFVPFEECIDGKDNNGDGLADCNDPQCVFTPMCGGTFNFQSNANDKTAPSVIFSKADTFIDGAFVKFDTNEPANGSVEFYRTNSSCAAAALNKTIIDVGDPIVTFDDYKPFHMAPIDNFAGNPQRLGYNLQNGTAYYYKVKVCDPTGNCGVSACANFTTASTSSNFVFKMGLPPGFKMDIPTWGVSDDNMTYGKQTNVTSSKDINITVKCPESGYQMTLVGVDVLKAKDLDFSSAFTCNSTSELIGMNSTKWQSVLYDLNVDYVLITWANTGDIVYHCNDNGGDCEDVTDYTDCTSSNGVTTCKIPVTLGFSTYKIGTTSSQQPSGGGGGGGGSTTAQSINIDLGTAGTTMTATFASGQKFTVTYGGMQYGYKVTGVTSQVVTIQSLATFDSMYLFKSSPRGLDFDSDGVDDAQLSFEASTGGKASITFKGKLPMPKPYLLPVAAPKQEAKPTDGTDAGAGETQTAQEPQDAKDETAQVTTEAAGQGQAPAKAPVTGMAALDSQGDRNVIPVVVREYLPAGILLLLLAGIVIFAIHKMGRKEAQQP